MNTKQLSSFTIDKEVIKEFDSKVVNNEKSLTVELFMRKFNSENTEKVKSLKDEFYDRLPPNKKGIR